MSLLLNWCRENPAGLFLAIAILPGFACPASPLLILAGIVWGSTASAADLNGDGSVGAADITVLLSAWGACP